MEQFHELWMSERPANVMEYPRIRALFQDRIEKELAENDTLPYVSEPL